MPFLKKKKQDVNLITVFVWFLCEFPAVLFTILQCVIYLILTGTAQ